MHFYYIDETGCSGRNLDDAEQPIFALGGISVRDEGWNATQEAFWQILADYFGGNVPDGFELHANQMLGTEGQGVFDGHGSDRRYNLAERILRLLAERRHDVHVFAIDKAKIRAEALDINLPYDPHVPYLVAYDYLITYINSVVKERLGQSARGMIILDEKKEFLAEIERITFARRFAGPVAHRVKWVVEFSYPVDSQKNPMVQLSDLVIYCTRRFFEIEGGYRENWSPGAKEFYARRYAQIHDRIVRKELVARQGRRMDELNEFLKRIRAGPIGQWKKRYGI